jgi:hypothetical protein
MEARSDQVLDARALLIRKVESGGLEGHSLLYSRHARPAVTWTLSTTTKAASGCRRGPRNLWTSRHDGAQLGQRPRDDHDGGPSIGIRAAGCEPEVDGADTELLERRERELMALGGSG